MSDLAKRLRASLKMDAVNGDATERSVCARQMMEAAIAIEHLTASLAAAEAREKALAVGVNLRCGVGPDKLPLLEVDSLAKRLKAALKREKEANERLAADTTPWRVVVPTPTADEPTRMLEMEVIAIDHKEHLITVSAYVITVPAKGK